MCVCISVGRSRRSKKETLIFIYCAPVGRKEVKKKEAICVFLLPAGLLDVFVCEYKTLEGLKQGCIVRTVFFPREFRLHNHRLRGSRGRQSEHVGEPQQ